MPIRLPDLGPLLADDVATSRPELLVELGPSDVPLALLPVRLETRFFPVAGGSVELRVRVYPDKIHIDAHDPRLSAEELDWARRYWELQWHAGDDEARLRSAWQMLADRFEPHRAAWIARRTRPTNSERRPALPLDPETPLPEAPRLSDLGAPATTVRTPIARLLPDRWTATAYQGGLVVGVVTGRDVDAQLAIGPDLDDALAPATLDDESPAVDEGMRWMIDFDRAEDVGMAMRMALPGPVGAVDLDLLVVSGIRGALTGDAGAAAMADILDAHHYTDGLGFVPPATPSNNTPDQRAGFASSDPRQERSFADEWLSPRVNLAGVSNGAATSRALGFDGDRADATLARVPAAADGDEPVAASMQAALWPVTWGYFLTQMVGVRPSGLSLDDVDWARAHATAWVRPGGPLPTLRCGRQPYGLLPVTSLGRWTPAADDGDGARADRLRRVLVALRDGVWRPAVGRVARVGRSDNPNDDLVDVLLGGATSATFLVRRLMGPHYLRHLRLFLGEDLDAIGFWTVLAQQTARLPADAGSVPFLSLAVYEDIAETIRVPPVQATDDGQPPEALDPNYIRELLDVDDVEQLVEPTPTAGTPLLRVLLRHALLREQVHAAARLVARDDLPVGRLLHDTELVDLKAGQPPMPTWTWLRDQTVPGVEPPQTVQQHLRGLTDLEAAPVRSLGQHRAALEVLAATPPADLERHLAGTLDAASHRLDAWVSSFATARLAELRAQRPTGLAIGGYGWVEHLRPEPQRAVATAPAGEPGPLVAPDADPGFIHAPSLDQAAAAALLRNAHLSHGGVADGPYAIQLTSSRVRLAQRLFDGVRQGQTLGALLGYDFERRLHTTQLDEFIDDFRRLAPRPGQQGDVAVEKRFVLDGLVLHRRWRAEGDALLGRLAGLGGATDPRQARLRSALAALGSAIDAAADAVTAESAYQLVRGNLTRGATSFDDIAAGQVAPPQLEFMRTPRSGTGATHRVVVLLDAGTRTPDGASGWAGADTSVRARAEPVLNAWLARLLGPARGVVARVHEIGADGTVQTTHDVELPQLGLAPLDLAWMSSGDHAELDERVLDTALGGPARSLPAGTRFVVDLSRRTGAPATERSLADLVEVAAAMQRLIGAARPADGADLHAPHAEPERGLDLAEYASRVAQAEGDLEDVARRLSDLARSGAPPTRGQVRAVLRRAGAFGIPGTGTAAGSETDLVDEASALRIQIAAVLTEVTRRTAEASQLRTTGDQAPDNLRRDRILKRFQAVFGSGFVALARFRCPDAASVQASLDDARSLRGDDALAAHTWMHRMDRVRPGLARLGRALCSAEVLTGEGGLRLEIAQVPHVPGQRWVGAAHPAGEGIRDGCASLILQRVGDLDLGAPLAGLVVDEWTEVVPNATETTGLAFQYDPPDASAPQAVLLAVPPVIGEPWRVGTLNQLLIETLDLARLRAVGPALLGQIAHYLPATYLAFNVAGDAVSTDFNPVAS